MWLALFVSCIIHVYLVMEQPQRSMSKHDPMLIRRFDTLLIHNTATRCSQILHPALPRPMNIIREREERITRTAHPAQFLRPLPSLFFTQRRRDRLELVFPLRFLATLKRLTAHEQIDSVGFLSAFDAFLEWEGEDARMVTEPPVIGFRTCKTGAMDTGLLTCS